MVRVTPFWLTVYNSLTVVSAIRHVFCRITQPVVKSSLITKNFVSATRLQSQVIRHYSFADRNLHFSKVSLNEFRYGIRPSVWQSQTGRTTLFTNHAGTDTRAQHCFSTAINGTLTLLDGAIRGYKLTQIKPSVNLLVGLLTVIGQLAAAAAAAAPQQPQPADTVTLYDATLPW